MTNQHTDEMREERRLKKPAFNGCVREGRGEYCQPCVAMATNYEYTGETDRRKKPHKYAPFTPDVNFEEWYSNNCTVDLDLTSAKLGWAGATTRYQDALREVQEMLLALKAQELGDYIYDVRNRAAESCDGFEGLSWEHPDVVSFSNAIDGIDKSLANINKLLGDK